MDESGYEKLQMFTQVTRDCFLEQGREIKSLKDQLGSLTGYFHTFVKAVRDFQPTKDHWEEFSRLMQSMWLEQPQQNVDE